MDASTITEILKAMMPPTLSLIITSIASIFIGICIEKFKQRIALLKYEIIYQGIGTTLQDQYWGNITVSHNNRIINHLNFVTIKIYNESNKDLENINFDIYVADDDQILGQSSYYDNAKIAILLENEFYKNYKRIYDCSIQDQSLKSKNDDHKTPINLENEISWVQKNRKFNLPVFNRNSSISIHLLLENFKGETPLVTVDTIHKSTKLLKKGDIESENRKTGVYSLFLGAVIYFTFALILITFYPESKSPIKILAGLGLIQILLGYFLYLFICYLKRQFN